MIAAGVHACGGNDAVNDYAWFTRIGLLQDATNSSATSPTADAGARTVKEAVLHAIGPIERMRPRTPQT